MKGATTDLLGPTHIMTSMYTLSNSRTIKKHDITNVRFLIKYLIIDSYLFVCACVRASVPVCACVRLCVSTNLRNHHGMNLSFRASGRVTSDSTKPQVQPLTWPLDESLLLRAFVATKV